MATTTPNFGWSVPTSTDLVKDGATAIETLGDSIDASLVDLKGGTTGQVLSKASNTDLDYTWVTQDDANAIQNTQLTAKGALISAFSAGTPATLTVGTNGQVLTADSTAATGLAWATAGGSSGPAFWARRATSSQSLSSGVLTKIQFNSEEFDTDNCYDPTTNYRFTANKAGYYSFNTNILMDGGSMTSGEVGFRKNGTSWAFGTFGAPASGYLGVSCNTIIYLNGSSDYVEVWGTNYGGGNVNAAITSFFSGVWIRS